MAQTLEQLIAVGGETSAREVVDILQKESPLFSVLPFVKATGTYVYSVQSKLGSADFRERGGTYGNDAAEYEKKVEHLRSVGTDVVVDNEDVYQYSEDINWFAKQMELGILNTKHRFQKGLIHGDSELNRKEFDGLLKRVTAEQSIEATEDIVSDLDDIVSRIKGRGADILIMNKATQNKVTAAARIAQVTETKNNFGTIIKAYNSVPIIALDNDEMENDCVIAAQLGEQGVHGVINPETIRAVELGEATNAPTKNGRVELMASVVVVDPKALAVRKPAAAPAE